MFVLCMRAAPGVRLPEGKYPRVPVPRAGRGGGKRRVLCSGSAKEQGGSETEEALAGPLPGACPGSLHARRARGMSVSPAHPHSAPAPRCAGGPGLAAVSSARPRCPSRRSPASPPRSRDSPGRPRPGPPPGQPQHHPQPGAPSGGGRAALGLPRRTRARSCRWLLERSRVGRSVRR